MATVEKVISYLVYASVLLGVLFLWVLSGISGFPAWLFYAIAGGEGLWILCAVLVARRAWWAPYFAVVLALITLAVSLPQPAHYTFAGGGQDLALLIFAGGSALEFALIGAFAVFVFRSRRR